MKNKKAPIKGKLLLDRETIRHLKRILSKEDLMRVAGGGGTSYEDDGCTQPH